MKIREVIPDGLKPEHLKYFDELQEMLPKKYFVDKGSIGWNVHKIFGWFLFYQSTVAWVWWHSKTIEVYDFKVYDILKEFGQKHKFKEIVRRFAK